MRQKDKSLLVPAADLAREFYEAYGGVTPEMRGVLPLETIPQNVRDAAALVHQWMRENQCVLLNGLRLDD